MSKTTTVPEFDDVFFSPQSGTRGTHRLHGLADPLKEPQGRHAARRCDAGISWRSHRIYQNRPDLLMLILTFQNMWNVFLNSGLRSPATNHEHWTKPVFKTKLDSPGMYWVPRPGEPSDPKHTGKEQLKLSSSNQTCIKRRGLNQLEALRIRL